MSNKDSPHLERHGSRAKMMKMFGTSQEEIDRASQIANKNKKSKDKKRSESKNLVRIKWPENYIFCEEDSPNNILFEENLEQLRAGTLVKLVERLTFDDKIDPNYPFEFLLTYRSFTSPQVLLNLLISRWNMPNNIEILSDDKDQEDFNAFVRRPIRLRVFNVLKKWMEEHWYDWESDSRLIDCLRIFIDENVKKDMEIVATTLTKILSKKLDGTQETGIAFSKSPPESHEVDIKQLTGTTGNSSHLAFLAFHPEEIARQMTLIEWDLFKSIKPWECIGQSWAKKDKETKAPNILGMILRFNKVSMWVKNTIVQTENLKSRTEALTRFIEVSERLRSLNNFNGIMEILAGLRSAAVHRLKKTWEGVSGKNIKVFEELSDLMSPHSNYIKFRNYLHKEISPPCIPYLGVYLTDLTFIEEGNPDKIQEDKLINFDKRRRIAAVINEIKQYQQTPYYLAVVPIIKGFLLAGGEYVDENECYKLSLLRESKDIPKENGNSPTVEKKKKMKKFMRKSMMLVRSESRKKFSSSSQINGGSSPDSTSSSLSPISSSPISSSPSNVRLHRSVSLDNVIESALEGNNNSAIERYLDGLNKTEKEKEALREEINKMIESRQKSYEEEMEEIPFEDLISFLEEGNNAAFEKYLENFDYYDAELIRAQTVEQFTKRKAMSMFK